MITRLSHATLFVLDQDVAKDFYVNKLGFELRNDVAMEGGFRWLTIGAKAQPDVEIILMGVGAGPIMDEESAEQIRGLIAKGALGTGVLETDDCQRTYEELVAKGVEFKRPPEEQFYGIEALVKDPFGNWFSLVQRKH
jgi:catechol 2,3-dioxygenase-like lactoylglutathione lyase family enzyme